jgi:hypothetical protein
LFFLQAFPYALANLVVTSARDLIDSPLSMPHDVTVSRAFLSDAPKVFRGQFS